MGLQGSPGATGNVIRCGRECSGLELFVVFFFFQAEDGIRDYKVTGVQTCALPISEQGPLVHSLEKSGAQASSKTPRSGWTLGAACSGFALSAVFDTGAQLCLKVCASQGLSL